MPPGSQAPYRPPDGPLFRCEVLHERESARVQAVGELDLDTVPTLSAEVAQLREAGCRHVIIDLRELSFLDSSGLRFFLDCHADARQDGYTIALIPGPPVVQRVFALTRTTHLLPFIVG